MTLSTQPESEPRILVAGTGPAGLAAALALAGRGFGVILAGPPANTDDRRTTALMAPAVALLDEIGIGAQLLETAAPLRVMQIIDATSRLIRSPAVTFRASEIGESAFGYNIPNAHLNGMLEAAADRHERIIRHRSLVARWQTGDEEIVARLSDGTEVHAKLAVAADGRNSPARHAAGIRTLDRPHAQAAFITTFAHSRPHGFTSTEFHTETGPFTQVPLPGDRSSLVWVLRPAEAERLRGLDSPTLSRTIEDRMQSMLGRVTVDGEAQVYPLSASLPERFAARRIALVGEAAHLFPPIGAQGLNLGLRDVADLVTTAARFAVDPGAAAAMSDYDAARRPDILARTAAVELLNRSLLSGFLPVQMLRGAGLAMLGGLAPLRGFFMREGLRPGSGFRSLLERSREKIGG